MILIGMPHVARVAQSGLEHFPPKEGVAGSSPAQGVEPARRFKISLEIFRNFNSVPSVLVTRRQVLLRALNQDAADRESGQAKQRSYFVEP